MSKSKSLLCYAFVSNALVAAVLAISLSLGLAITGIAVSEAQAQGALNIDEILSAANRAAGQDRSADAAREKRFQSNKGKEQGRLNKTVSERKRQEKISDELDRTFSANEVAIEELQAELIRELGELKELFGVIQLTASEAQEEYKTSLITAQYPGRAKKLQVMVEKMSSLTELVSIDELEELWYELQNELTEQGKIVKFSAPVNYKTSEEVDSEGNKIAIYEPQDREITRVGVFNAVAGNDIASYDNEKGFIALDRQMRGEFNSLSNDLQSSSSGVSSFLLDPTKGALLTAYVTKPTLAEKVQEGGVVGYVIIGLGILALIIAILRILMLTGVEAKVNKQAKDLKRPSLSNPLGRVLKVFQDNRDSDPESMELKLSEAMLKESPKLNSLIMFIKIIAVVAPLLGLLGTVTGMIQTFQAITLFGAGDPQTMAGGISQALVTTVLGLVVAIPTVFLHWLASSRAKRVEDKLEEHAAGLIAEQYESQG